MAVSNTIVHRRFSLCWQVRSIHEELEETQQHNERLSLIVRKLGSTLRAREDGAVEMEHTIAQLHADGVQREKRLSAHEAAHSELEQQLEEVMELNEDLEQEAVDADAKLPHELQEKYDAMLEA